MDIGYKRLSKSGPSEAEQDAALIAAGVVMDLGLSLYVDLAPTKRRPASFDERDNAIRCLRPGDRLVIHSAPRLGATEAEIRAAAAAVSANGAVIFDCAAGIEVRHHPDAGRLIAWAEDGAAQARAERLGKARKGITKRGAPPKALAGEEVAAARRRWKARPVTGESVAAIAAAFSVSPRTLYREAKARGWRMPDGG
jgi:DNA invertase Pin-like site-specific DNA recombinase